MVAAHHIDQPDSSFRGDRPREHAQGQWVRGIVAQLSGVVRHHAGSRISKHMAFSEAAQLSEGVRMRILVFLIPTCLFAQLGPPASQGQPARATQLPLSGRGGQSGSVTVTEAPVPGTTTSLNTINPSIQIQGPFGGSVESKAPFPGELSFQDAINRGLQYNLGAVGLSNAVRQAHGQARVA